MDLPRYAAMSRYWDAHPPLHMMVQGYLGIEGKQADSKKVNDSEGLATFMQSFQAAGGISS